MLTPRYEATSCQVFRTRWARCSGTIHQEAPSRDDIRTRAKRGIVDVFTSGRLEFYRSPSPHRLIAYLPRFASICALPGRNSALDSLEKWSKQTFRFDRRAPLELA